MKSFIALLIFSTGVARADEWRDQRQSGPGGWSGVQYESGGTLHQNWQGPGGQTLHCQSYRWRPGEIRTSCY